MGLKFGTSGVRGLVSDMTPQELYLFTVAFLEYAQSIGQHSEVAIGYDLRPSSPSIFSSIVDTVTGFGREVFDCGELPTPALAFYAQKKTCLAIMITGSHIPADRNGIKFYLESGETLKSDDAEILKRYDELKVAGRSFERNSNNPLKVTDTKLDAKKLYIDRYVNFFPPGCLIGSKLVFYQHSSVARDLYPEILHLLGARVSCVGKSNTFVPVDTEAVDSIDNFKNWILEYEADGLISTDGDGDRPLFIDENGSLVPGDKIGAYASIYLGCKDIAIPISCNSAISEAPQIRTVLKTKIGSPFVISALNELAKKSDKVAGFEANGGFMLQSGVQLENAFLDPLPTRDSVLPVLSALLLAKKNGLKISQLSTLIPLRYTSSGLIRNYSNEKSQALLKNATRDPVQFLNKVVPHWDFHVERINNLDGLRIEGSKGLTVHLRPSGNAPEFRCYTEAPEQALADQLCDDTLNSIKEIF